MNKNWSKKYQLILWTVTLIIIVCALIYHVFGFASRFGWGFDSDKDFSMTAKTFDYSGKTVTDVYVNMNAADLDIYYGDEFTVKYDFVEKYAPTVDLTNGKLSIEQKMKVTRVHDIGDCKLHIIIPRGTKLETVDLDINAGDVDVNALEGKSFSLDVDAGDVDVTKINFEETNVSADAGDIKIEDSSLGRVNVDANLGNIDLKDVEFTTGNVSADAGDISVDGTFEKLKGACDLGAIRVDTPDPDAVDLDLDVSLGDIKVNGKKW